LLKSLTLLTAIALTATTTSWAAETWPQRPIKIIVPFAAGGAVDVTARLLAEPIAKALGATIIVENHGGGGGLPASELLVRSPPDGYTISLVSVSYAANAVVQPNLSFDVINDITPISLAVINTVMILVPADSPYKNLQDLLDAAKAKPNTISYGTVGFGSAMHFAGELLNTRAGTKMIHVPYRGAAPALNDLLGGHLSVAILGIGPVLPHVRSGKLRALAITTAKRSQILPEIPTVAELGYPGYQSGEWFALIAPKGLSSEIQNRLHDAFVTAISSPEIKNKLEAIGLEATSTSPQELKEFLTSEVARIRLTAEESKMLENTPK
jgi:tripartite-type tricarboxylate transporter receptor subunit TctC